MQPLKKLKSIVIICGLLLFCMFLTASAFTRLDEPAFTQVYYEQSNGQQEHVVYFYLIDNLERGWGEPFRFCFPEAAAIHCTLQPITDYEQYSAILAQEQQKWKQGRRNFGRYRVELLELRFVIPDAYLQECALHLTKGKIYFQDGHYRDLQIGDIIIVADDTAVNDYNGQGHQHAMTYITVGDFSEHPYFSDFLQVWTYLQTQSKV